jgi:DNA-binding NarL/FixJ family response regulator
MDVLEAMARGATTTAQLAAALHISTDTVKTHVGTVLSKLEVPNRAAAIVRAHQLGLVHSRRDD